MAVVPLILHHDAALILLVRGGDVVPVGISVMCRHVRRAVCNVARTRTVDSVGHCPVCQHGPVAVGRPAAELPPSFLPFPRSPLFQLQQWECARRPTNTNDRLVRPCCPLRCPDNASGRRVLHDYHGRWHRSRSVICIRRGQRRRTWRRLYNQHWLLDYGRSRTEQTGWPRNRKCGWWLRLRYGICYRCHWFRFRFWQ